ncbi:MAG: acetylxylan esterase [Chthoniobacterales bacterium]
MRHSNGHLMQNYWLERMRTQRRDRLARLKAIRTRKDAEKYREEAQRCIRKIFGPFPKKTPLNAKVTKITQREGYRIENVILESRPGFMVTANLYVPDNLKKQVPGILGSCGHTENGKGGNGYQHFNQRLVQAGMVSILFDPISQGERNQHMALPVKTYARRSCVTSHCVVGNQLELADEFFGAWRAWDGIRVLDYLASRPEVDVDRLGMTGNSGGGTMTSWIWGLEDRLKVGAPSCFIAPFLSNVEDEMPQDSEQCPPGLLSSGYDIDEFFIARAPHPIILLGQKYDFFDRRGFGEIARELKRFYGFFGAEKNADSFLGNNHHGYFPDSQEAMVTFMCKHMKVPRPKKAPVIVTEKDETLFATPTGDVTAEGSIPIPALLQAKVKEFVKNRKPLSKDALKRELSRVLGLPERKGVPYFRVLRPFPYYSAPKVARYAVETEKNIDAILTKTLEDGFFNTSLDVEKGEVSLYLPHLFSEEEVTQPWAKSLRKKGPLYMLDVRGLGETLPYEEPSFLAACSKDYMYKTCSYMFGETYIGRRVHDVLSVIDLLIAEGATGVRLYGRGQGALHALFASVIHPKVTRTILKNYPRSFGEWASAPLLKWPGANMIKGILKVTDIPECLKALGSKVTLSEPWSPTMTPIRRRR